MATKKDRTNDLLKDIEQREDAIAELKAKPRTARTRQAIRDLEQEIGLLGTLLRWQQANLENAARA